MKLEEKQFDINNRLGLGGAYLTYYSTPSVPSNLFVKKCVLK